MFINLWIMWLLQKTHLELHQIRFKIQLSKILFNDKKAFYSIYSSATQTFLSLSYTLNCIVQIMVWCQMSCLRHAAKMCNRQGLEPKAVRFQSAGPEQPRWGELSPKDRSRGQRCLLTCARSLVWHEGEPRLAAALIAAFRVCTEGLTAAVHYTAFVDV